jgi:hypothetical protein
VRFDGGPAIALVPFQPSGLSRGANAVNRLELSCVGSTIAASINGTAFVAVEDATHASGSLVLGINTLSAQPVAPPGPSELRLRNLRVTQP